MTHGPVPKALPDPHRSPCARAPRIAPRESSRGDGCQNLPLVILMRKRTNGWAETYSIILALVILEFTSFYATAASSGAKDSMSTKETLCHLS